MYGDDWQEIAEATSTKTPAENDQASADDLSPKTILKLYALNIANSSVYFALPEIDKLKTDSVNYISGLLFG